MSLQLAGLGYNAQRSAAVALLRAGLTFTPTELADELGVSASRCADILRELHHDGHVVRAGRPVRYSIAEP